MSELSRLVVLTNRASDLTSFFVSGIEDAAQFLIALQERIGFINQ